MAATKPNTIHWPWIPDCVLKFPQNNFKIRQTEYTFASKCRFFWYCFMRIKYWLSTQPVQRTHCCNAARGDDTQPILPLATPPPPTHSNKPLSAPSYPPLLPNDQTQCLRGPPGGLGRANIPLLEREVSPWQLTWYRCTHYNTLSIPFDPTETGEVNWIP